MTEPLGVALVQYPPNPVLGDLLAFLRAQVPLKPHMRLWVFPELHLGPRVEQAPHQAARALTDPELAQLGQVAAELGIWLIPGSIYERGANGTVYNTALVYAPDGTRVSSYRKIFPWRPLETSVPGTEFEVFEIPGHGTIGLSICYDIWFPEHTRQLAWLGADMVINMVQTGTSERSQEQAIVTGNAVMNQLWVASVNTASPVGRGRSLIVDPEGVRRAELPGAEPGILTCMVDLGQTRTVRNYGTAGVSSPFKQFYANDVPIHLPMYDGYLTGASMATALGEPTPPPAPGPQTAAEAQSMAIFGAPAAAADPTVSELPLEGPEDGDFLADYSPTPSGEPGSGLPLVPEAGA